jgi:hypothetical protein
MLARRGGRKIKIKINSNYHGFSGCGGWARMAPRVFGAPQILQGRIDLRWVESF